MNHSLIQQVSEVDHGEFFQTVQEKKKRIQSEVGHTKSPQPDCKKKKNIKQVVMLESVSCSEYEDNRSAITL